MKLKKAPNLKNVLKENVPPEQEIYILIGNPWEFYRLNPKDEKTNGQGLNWQLLADLRDHDNPNRYNESPVILDDNALDNLFNLAILPDAHEVASIIDKIDFFKVKSIEKGITILENQKLLTYLFNH